MIIVSPAPALSDNIAYLRVPEMIEIYQQIITTGNVVLELQDPQPYDICQQTNLLLWERYLLPMCMYGFTIEDYLFALNKNHYERFLRPKELELIFVSAAEDVERQPLAYPHWIKNEGVVFSHQRYLASIDPYYQDFFGVDPIPWPVINPEEIDYYKVTNGSTQN